MWKMKQLDLFDLEKPESLWGGWLDNFSNYGLLTNVQEYCSRCGRKHVFTIQFINDSYLHCIKCSCGNIFRVGNGRILKHEAA